MKNYELVIEQRQPTCGGRAPTKNEIRMVSTDDPMAYVRAQEPGCEPEIVRDEDGVVEIKFQRNGLWVRYEFTED